MVNPKKGQTGVLGRDQFMFAGAQFSVILVSNLQSSPHPNLVIERFLQAAWLCTRMRLEFIGNWTYHIATIIISITEMWVP